MNEKTRYARDRAQNQVKRMTDRMKRAGVGLQPPSAFQRAAILDTEVLTLIDLVGQLLPGGEAQVWDAIAKRAGETADAWDAQKIAVVDRLPSAVKPS